MLVTTACPVGPESRRAPWPLFPPGSFADADDSEHLDIPDPARGSTAIKGYNGTCFSPNAELPSHTNLREVGWLAKTHCRNAFSKAPPGARKWGRKSWGAPFQNTSSHDSGFIFFIHFTNPIDRNSPLSRDSEYCHLLYNVSFPLIFLLSAPSRLLLLLVEALFSSSLRSAHASFSARSPSCALVLLPSFEFHLACRSPTPYHNASQSCNSQKRRCKGGRKGGRIGKRKTKTKRRPA